ncbi:MAG: hypothetical protein OXG43_04990 [Chloroflexi bacterium]|nr:hypothetical protein [Chloroflexota bacterium]
MEQGVAQTLSSADDRLGALDGIANGVKYGGDGPLFVEGRQGKLKISNVRLVYARLIYGFLRSPFKVLLRPIPFQQRETEAGVYVTTKPE